jgi:DNA-binding response OmpR family regulator
VVKNSAILFSPDDATPPTALTEWLARQADVVLTIHHVDDLMAMSLRGRPRAVAFDARSAPEAVYDALRRLKRDSYTGVVPAVVLAAEGNEAFDEAFRSGADEVVRESLELHELLIRLDAMLRRSDRDLVVHPSTRLPGAAEIENDVARRLKNEVRFAMCYADPVRDVLRGPRSLQGVQRPVFVLRRRSGHPDPGEDSA